MKKLSLKLDDLAVESFSTHEAPTRSGTVRGFETEYMTCAGTCVGCVWSEDGGAYCTYDCTGGNTIGEHCGPQGTMNPMWSECVTATMAGATCEGASCGQACTYLNC